jgi:hypothetical protein
MIHAAFERRPIIYIIIAVAAARRQEERKEGESRGFWNVIVCDIGR